VENACIFSASWDKPRLFSITKVKHTAMNVFSLEIFQFKIEIACGKKLKRDVVTIL
jgi:hypothetical protein